MGGYSYWPSPLLQSYQKCVAISKERLLFLFVFVFLSLLQYLYHLWFCYQFLLSRGVFYACTRTPTHACAHTRILEYCCVGCQRVFCTSLHCVRVCFGEDST